MISWIISINPSKLPKFHHILKLTGEGRSTKVLFKILKRGSEQRARIEVTDDIYYEIVFILIKYRPVNSTVNSNIFLKKIKTC